MLSRQIANLESTFSTTVNVGAGFDVETHALTSWFGSHRLTENG